MKSRLNPLLQLSDLAEFRFQMRSFLAFSEAAAEKHGVTPQQYQLLQVVALGSLHGTPITLVAERLLLRHNSAVELIDRAALAGLVRRAADPDDHRRSLIRLTPRGRGVLSRLIRHHIDFLHQSGPALMTSLESLLHSASPQEKA